MKADERMELRGLTYEQMEAWLTESLGAKRFRARQIYAWLHKRYARSFAEMTDLSKAFREQLTSVARIDTPLVEQVFVAEDGTRKYRMKAVEGEVIEAVFIPGASSEKHNALCISSQVGCAMGCAFCLTGRSGLIRNLSAAEIVGQVAEVARDVAESDQRITNIVFMGMGEPLHNLGALLPSLEILCGDLGFDFSTRRVTVSTSGLIPGLRALAKARQIPQLAISLNAPDDAIREHVMPVNKRWNISALMDACMAFPLANRRHITFEYVLMAGLNDSVKQALQVAKIVEPVRAMVNLIPFNPHPGSQFSRPTRETSEAFQAELRRHGVRSFIRHTRGDEVLAACGTLSDVPYFDPKSEEEQQIRSDALAAIDAIRENS
jgi:23S rRNA (adenine2503-C2)-methyltransferase